VEEREHACDEEVLVSGRERQVYAESILKVCEFCVESPLACVSGVTSSDLKERVVRIMSERVARRLDFSRRMLLATAGALALALPILTGVLNAAQTQTALAASARRGAEDRAASQAQSGTAFASGFQIASIKPNNGTSMAGHSIMWKADRFMATNLTLHKLIQRAYDVQDDQILGGPIGSTLRHMILMQKWKALCLMGCKGLAQISGSFSRGACFKRFPRTASSSRFTVKLRKWQCIGWSLRATV